MITLTNKQTNYTAENSSENLKLSGSLSFNEDGRILAFNGAFQTLQDTYVGNFYYNENSNNKTTKSISEIDTDKCDEADKLLDDTIKELKQQISEL